MRTRLVTLAIFVAATCQFDRLFAQGLSIGAIGGVRATDELSGTLTPESKRYIVGPTVELSLPLRLAVEFDALYRRVGYTGYSSTVLANSITRVRANSWEFPLIAKYRMPFFLVHPFVGVGYAPRTIHGNAVASGSYLSRLTQNPPASVITYFFNQRTTASYSVTHGVVAAAGVDLHAGPIRLSPELRYVHWSSPFLNAQGGDGSFLFTSSQNEVFLMLGVSWH